MRPFVFLGGDPFRELRRLQHEMDRLAGAFAPAGGLAAAGFPAVNVYAGRDGIAVVAELPGGGAGELEGRPPPGPFRVAPARGGAPLEQGVLRLSLQRPEEEKPPRIAIAG